MGIICYYLTRINNDAYRSRGITLYMINILNFRPLDYIIYMFITLNMHAFVLIECYLLFDPQTHFLCLIFCKYEGHNYGNYICNLTVGRER